MNMPVKNYTTKVPANKSISQIQDMLVRHGAVGVLLNYEKGTGRIEALKFMLQLEGKSLPFSLPVDWRSFQALLKEQRVQKWRDEDYCYRVAWRVVRDWVDAQMAFYETQMVTIPQIFLPYVVTKSGNTLYEDMAIHPERLLGSGN